MFATAGTTARSTICNIAFFNGVGYESWENIWGIWNQITPRDAEALRRVATIERAIRANFLISPRLAALRANSTSGVYASRWPQGKSTLWTIVNRNQYDVEGRQSRLPAEAGTRYFDLWHGVELKPESAGMSSGFDLC